MSPNPFHGIEPLCDNPLDEIPPEDFIVHLHGDGWWCGIKLDGSFEYGGNYKPDEAAAVFWQGVCKRLKVVPKKEASNGKKGKRKKRIRY